MGGRPIVYALTSDHGVTSFPEYLKSKGRMARRARPDSAVLQTWRVHSRPSTRPISASTFNNGLMLADVAAIRKAGINFDSLASAIASKLAHITGVTRVYTPKILAAADTADLDAMRWRRSIPKDFGWIAAASLAPGYIWSFSPAATTHGTTNRDDVLVPIVFMGPGIAAGKYNGGAHGGHRPHPRRVPRHQAARARGRDRAAGGGQVAMSVPHRALPCFPCPHQSACCRFGTTVTEEEAQRDRGGARWGEGLPDAVGRMAGRG